MPRREIRQLYENDARGLVDEALIDEVAYGFLARCESILTVTEAALGRVKCPRCGYIISRHGGREELLECEDCSWKITWGAYFKTYHRKQLSGGGAVSVFREFTTELPKARSPTERMLLIDRLIHECHKGRTPPAGEEMTYTRPVAVNLIAGTMTQVIALLDDPAYGPGSTPGAGSRYATWRENVLSSIEGKGKWLP